MKREQSLQRAHIFQFTLTSRYRGVPCMVAQWRAAACCCGIAYEAVTAVTSPSYHAVNVTATLRGDGAVEWGVWGGAVQSCRRRNAFKTASHVETYCR